MSADYSPPARTLAEPIPPIISPRLSEENERPPFSRISSQPGRRRNTVAPEADGASYKNQAIRTAKVVHKKMIAIYKAMSLLQLILAGIGSTIIIVLGVLMLVFSHQFFAWLEPIAHKWRDLPGGWAILWAGIFITGFPPVIGYSLLITTSGFVFGFWRGWLIAATSATIGSVSSFIACRTVLTNYVNRLVGDDPRFKALGLTLKHDGIRILILVRLCPLPYSLSNGAMSTIPTITIRNFALGTALATPKLMIHSFIGSRLALIAGVGGKLDKTTQLINYASVVGGGLLGLGLGYFIYKKTTERARQLELEEQELEREEEGRGLVDPNEFEGADEAGTMNEDDISLWNNDEGAYRDDFTDEEGAHELDEEAVMGSKTSEEPGK